MSSAGQPGSPMQRTPPRRKADRSRIVMISGLVAAASFAALSYGPGHAIVVWIYGAFLLAAMVYVISQLVRIKRAQRQRKAAAQQRREGQA